MKADQEKKQDDIIRNIIRDSGIDEAPRGFANSVMQAVHSSRKASIATTYKPLISKNAWVFFGFAVLGVCIYLLTNDQQVISIGHYIPFSEYISDFGMGGLVEKLAINGMDNINTQSNLLYALLMLPIFFLFQIYFLQRKRI